MQNRQYVLRSVVALVACASMGACITTSTASSVSPSTPSDNDWLDGSPEFERMIDDESAKLPYLQRPEEFVNSIEFFRSAGEPAYPRLLQLAASDDPKVAGVALAALGETRDSRLVPHIQQIPWPEGGDQKLDYERARCLVKLGDWEPIGILVDGLEDEALLARAQCFKALRDATSETFDYHPQAEEADRAVSVARWREWLGGLELDPMLGK